MTRTKIQQLIAAGSASLVLVLGVITGSASAATYEVCPSGSVKQGNNCKVTICHRTDSVTSPYVRPTVDIDAVDTNSAVDKGVGDHFNEHQGPIATSEVVAQALKDAGQKWGDIIPPVTGVEPGLNWTAEGQAIYNNGCNYVTPGGSGGGENPGTPGTPGTPNTPSNPQVLGESTTATPAQVTATPTGSVAAGAGSAVQLSAASVVGLTGSVATVLGGVVFALKRRVQL